MTNDESDENKNGEIAGGPQQKNQPTRTECVEA